jgi:hypothetical protein
MEETCFNLPYKCESKDSNDYLKEMDIDFISQDIIDNYLYCGKIGLSRLKLIKMRKGKIN